MPSHLGNFGIRQAVRQVRGEYLLTGKSSLSCWDFDELETSLNPCQLAAPKHSRRIMLVYRQVHHNPAAPMVLQETQEKRQLATLGDGLLPQWLCG